MVPSRVRSMAVGGLLALALTVPLSVVGCRDTSTPSSTPGASGGSPVSSGTGGAAQGTGGASDTTLASTSPGATCSGLPLDGNGGSTGFAIVPLLSIGPTQTQPIAPPAISGGTLLILPGDQTAVAADPDRDQIYVVDLVARQVTATIPVNPGDEPGRVIADTGGRVHVALRHGGAVVTIDPVAGTIIQRRQVCAAPRGLAHDAATDLIHVACAGGELVSLPAAGGAAVRTLHLDRDLRDVVVEGDHLWVSRFRSAEILTVDAAGTISGRASGGKYRHATTRGGQLFSPAVGWRMVGVPGGGVAMVHQRGVDDEVQHGQSSGSYGGADPCQAIVHSAVTRVMPDGTVSSGPALADLPLPVDFAISQDGTDVAIVSAANAHATNGGSSVIPANVHENTLAATSDAKGGCILTTGRSPCVQGRSCGADIPYVSGEAIAVAFMASGSIVVQSREPAVIDFPAGSIQLSPDSRADTGHMLFHANAGGALACASCHAEGNDDGRVWNFACAGPRRTQSLQTGIRGTEPFHWDGDEKDFPQLVRDVFTARMSGPVLRGDQTDSILSWVDDQPRPPKAAPVDTTAVERGHVLFNGKAACAACHVGPQLTNNQTVDVGTGGAFQVPSLVGIASHPPYMHTGCASSLRERFLPACGGGDKHGLTSGLGTSELSDLISYLETL